MGLFKSVTCDLSVLLEIGQTPDHKLKGHCHGDFSAFWSKLLNFWKKNLFFLT